MFLTPLELKPHITANCNSFTIESYDEVYKDCASGFDIPSDCGYVERIVNNVIGVKYTPAYYSDRPHKNIPISKAVRHNFSPSYDNSN